MGGDEVLGGGPMRGLYAEAPESSLALHRVRTQQEGAVYDPGSRASPDTEPANTLLSDLQPPEL